MALKSQKSWFSNFGLVHVDVKLLEDSESELIFCIFWCKSGQKHGFMMSFSIFECIEIYPNLAINHRFWPLLRKQFEEIRSDSESLCNFTSTCTKPKIENQFFLWFRAQYFQKIWLKNRYILGTFLIKSLFRPILATFLDKLRAPSGNIDDFPSIDLYIGGLAKQKKLVYRTVRFRFYSWI